MGLPTEDQPKLPIWRRVLKVIWVPLGVAALGWLMIGRSAPIIAQTEDQLIDIEALAVVVIVFVVLGVLGLIASGFMYAIALLSNVLTTDFSGPIWRGANGRLWWADQILSIAIGISIAMMLMAVLLPIGVYVRMTFEWAMMLSLFFAMVGGFALLCTIDIWAPAQRRLFDRRMAAIAPTVPEGATTFDVGATPGDADKKSCMRYTEQDIGLLVLDGNQLSYHGDAINFAFTSDQVMSIARMTDADGSESLVGGRQLAVHWREGEDEFKSVRIFSSGGIFTSFGLARRGDEIAEALHRWRDQAASTAAKSDAARDQASPLVT